MIASPKSLFACLLWLLLSLSVIPAWADYDDEVDAPTPPRLSYARGDVSLSRSAGAGWDTARLNTALAEGDMLQTGKGSVLELQLSSRAFVRADANTQLRLIGQDTQGIRFEVVFGRVTFDVRALPEAGYVYEVDTRDATLSFERDGYYRIDADRDARFIVRRGGMATLQTRNASLTLRSADAAWVSGDQAETGPAPAQDAWDRWNVARTDDLIAAISARYLPDDVAGAYDLDRYGSWSDSSYYGPVWIPYSVMSGWVPYGSGYWMWDPYYQWTWIDDAPWGWAPFHYGRWVYLGNRWAWVPGPRIRRAVYAPALVAFFSLGSSFQTGWVALSWGEPVIPWWGRPGFHGKPSWRGWGGPRLVNRAEVTAHALVDARAIRYENNRINNALIAVPREQFGKMEMQKLRPQPKARVGMTPLAGALPEPAAQWRGRERGGKVPASSLGDEPTQKSSPTLRSDRLSPEVAPLRTPRDRQRAVAPSESGSLSPQSVPGRSSAFERKGAGILEPAQRAPASRAEELRPEMKGWPVRPSESSATREESRSRDMQPEDGVRSEMKEQPVRMRTPRSALEGGSQRGTQLEDSAAAEIRGRAARPLEPPVAGAGRQRAVQQEDRTAEEQRPSRATPYGITSGFRSQYSQPPSIQDRASGGYGPGSSGGNRPWGSQPDSAVRPGLGRPAGSQ